MLLDDNARWKCVESLRILWYNWRCIKHPLAGGAEVYTHEIAKRLVKQGHEIILVSSRPKSLPREETISGYKVIRVGNKYTVYLEARKVYRNLKIHGFKPDLVIDEVNTIPFLTPKFAEEPIAMLIHQLCKDCWSYAINPLAQPVGWWLEKKLHTVYIESARNGKLETVITVSPSAKKDLIELGYPRDKIYIVYNGLDWNVYKDCTEQYKDKYNRVVYLGRITPYKRLEDLINAWKLVEQENIDAKLIIAGRPDPKYLKKLNHLAKKLNLEQLEFMTNITQQEKKLILATAKALVYTSTREGWGQTILEAAACGTPAIAYNVPGLKDSVKHLETGILVEPRNLELLAQTISWLLTDNNFRAKLSDTAYKYAQSLSWDKTAQTFSKIIRGVANE